jgi:hypothetical protein
VDQCLITLTNAIRVVSIMRHLPADKCLITLTNAIRVVIITRATHLPHCRHRRDLVVRDVHAVPAWYPGPEFWVRGNFIGKPYEVQYVGRSTQALGPGSGISRGARCHCAQTELSATQAGREGIRGHQSQ